MDRGARCGTGTMHILAKASRWGRLRRRTPMPTHLQPEGRQCCGVGVQVSLQLGAHQLQHHLAGAWKEPWVGVCASTNMSPHDIFALYTACALCTVQHQDVHRKGWPPRACAFNTCSST